MEKDYSNMQEAEQLWRKAIKITNNDSVSEEEKKEAIDLLQEAMKYNHAGAFYTMSVFLYRGYGVAQDYQKSYELCLKALELGYARAKWGLSAFYEEGHVVEKDLDKAKQLLVEAAEEGNADFCLSLAGIAFETDRFNMTEEEGMYWLKKSADMGHCQAKWNLALTYQRKQIELETAFQLLKELAESGYTNAEGDYAASLYQGIGCEKNEEEAVKWFKKGAEDGCPKAMCTIADRYFDGLWDCDIDYDKALELYTRSTDSGYTVAFFKLARFYGNLCNDEQMKIWLDRAREYFDVSELEKEYAPENFDERFSKAINSLIQKGTPEKALALAEKEADKGSLKAIGTLAEMRLYGIGNNHFGQDYEKSYHWFTVASSKGDMYATWKMGQFFESGVVVDKDPHKAYDYYLHAAETGLPEAQFCLGNLLISSDFENQDKGKALEWIEKSAEQGYAIALYFLGCAYLQDSKVLPSGSGSPDLVEQDVAKGMDFMKRAADKDHADALIVLSNCYELGEHVEKDLAKAFELLEKSAGISQDPYTVESLASHYREGIGTEKDPARAALLYQYGVDHNLLASLWALSEMYEKGEGVEKDEQKALALKARSTERCRYIFQGIIPLEQVKEQAKAGDVKAMYQLGNRYKDGDEVTQDIDLASDWWLKAAMQGYTPACHDLGIFYLYEKHDIDNALNWLNKSSEAGYAPSNRILGNIYINGWGVEKDISRGIDFMEEAAKQGDEEAQCNMAGIYHDGDVAEKDLGKFRYWMEKYLEGNSAEAHFYMGRCLYTGDMYNVDYDKALEHFTYAVKQGYHEASGYYIDMLWRGNNATQNQDEVIKTYQELAEKNDVVALYYLYTFYSDESYANKDVEKAKEYLTKAAELGYDVAITEMGHQHLQDGIFPLDLEKANDYFKQAADMGNTVAMVNLAISYETARGFEKDIKKALELYVQAADLNEGYAAYQAARIYINGEEGVMAPDYDKAIELLQDKAEGNADYCHLLAIAYEQKSSVPNGYSWELAEKGFQYMFKAAVEENAEAMFQCGYFLMEGRGVLINLDNAKLLFEEALKRECRKDQIQEILKNYFSSEDSPSHYPRCIYWNSIIENNPDLITEKEEYLDKDGVMNFDAVMKGAAQCGEMNAMRLYGYKLLHTDYEAGLKYLSRVIKEADADLADEVGRYYYNGDGLEKSMDRALEFFSLGVEAGSVCCAVSLGLIYTEDGNSQENKDYGKSLLNSVCEATDKEDELYKYAKTRLDKLEQEENSGWSKFSKGVRSIFGKK